MKKLFTVGLVVIMLLISSVCTATMIRLTKIYRCVATPELITYINPYEVQSGKTGFSDVYYPNWFQSDNLGEMEQYVITHGIIIYQE